MSKERELLERMKAIELELVKSIQNMQTPEDYEQVSKDLDLLDQATRCLEEAMKLDELQRN